MSAPSVAEALLRLGADTAARLCGEFALSPCRIPMEHARHVGALGASELTISTVVWTGRRALERLQIAQVSSTDDAMSSLTVVAMPSPSAPGPLFAADLVAFRGALGLAILDVHPLAEPLSDGARGALLRHRDVAMSVADARPWGDAHESPFSDLSVFAAPRPGGTEGIAAAYRGFLDAFVDELGARARDADAAAARLAARRRYLDALAGAKRQSRALARLFGQAWTDDYFDRLFFADELPAS